MSILISPDISQSSEKLFYEPAPEIFPSRKIAKPTKPKIRLAPPQKPARMTTLAFGIILGLILAAGMFGLLLLNTQIQHQYAILDDRRYEANVLTEQESLLERELAERDAAQNLMAEANALGMIPPGNVGYIISGTNKVSGNPAPATKKDYPALNNSVTSTVLAEQLNSAESGE